jgi:hypothetical protein
MFSSENQHNTVNSITYLNINDTIAGFTIETPIENEIYITHPAQLGEANQELILLSSLHSDSFLTSQDTEIVNTAREAGAKKVTISTYNSESKNELESSKGELDTKTIKTQASKNVSNNLKFSESSNLRFEFQGNETSIFNKVLKNFKSPEKEILKKSKWLQYDPDLTEFVLSCFSENKLSYFEKEVSMERQEVAIRSAKLALECNLFKSHNSIDGELDTKLASIKKHTKRYTVEF